MSSRAACLPVRSGGHALGHVVELAKFDSDVVRGQSHDEFIIWMIETIAWSRCSSLNIRVAFALIVGALSKLLSIFGQFTGRALVTFD